MKAQVQLEKGVYSVEEIASILENSPDNEWLANVVFLDSSTLFLTHQGKLEFNCDKSKIQKKFELQRLSAINKPEDRNDSLNKQLDSQEGLKSKIQDSNCSLWITIDTAPDEDGLTKAYQVARALQEVTLGDRYDQIVYGPKAFLNCHRLKKNLPLEPESEYLASEPEEEQGGVTQDVFKEDAPFANPMQKQGEVSKYVIEASSSTKHEQVQACVTGNVFGGDGSHTKPKEERADLPGNVFGEAVPLEKIGGDESGEDELGSTTNAEGSSQPVAYDFGDNPSSDKRSDSVEYDKSASMTKEDGDLPEMHPLEEWSRDLRQWLFISIYLSTPLDVYLRKKDYVRLSLVQLFNTTFLTVFRFDGFDPVNPMINSADGNKTPYTGSKLPFWLMLASFLGLPSRAESVVDGVPQFSGWQLLRNLFGVWVPVKETLSSQDGRLSFYQYRWTEKKIVQSVLLLFKLVLIFPIKLILMPFKIMLNIIKLATEVLLPLLSEYTARLNGALIVGLKDFCDERIPNGLLRAGLIFLGMIPLAAMAIIQYAMLWAVRLGLAFTSPEMSARLAFALGYSLTIGEKGSPSQRSISTVVGGLGAIASLALSGVLWTFTLPLAISALVTAIPSLLTAVTWISQLPIVATSLAWLGQWPLLTNLTVLLKSAISTVGGGLTLAFGPYIAPLATAMGFQISTAVMTVGTFLGMIAIPVGAILSRAADELSNVWARWVEQKPFARFGRWASGNNRVEITKKVSMPSENEAFVYQIVDGGDYVVSTRALNLKTISDEAIVVAGYKAKALFLRAKENKEYDSNEQARFPTAVEQHATEEYPVLAK